MQSTFQYFKELLLCHPEAISVADKNQLISVIHTASTGSRKGGMLMPHCEKPHRESFPKASQAHNHHVFSEMAVFCPYNSFINWWVHAESVSNSLAG